jgi:hypothetical protein
VNVQWHIFSKRAFLAERGSGASLGRNKYFAPIKMIIAMTLHWIMLSRWYNKSFRHPMTLTDG